jgi:long-chain fatty acid transport protein
MGKGQTGESMQRGFKQRGLNFAGAAAIGFLALASYAGGEAYATEGYFQYGWGARQGALAGAGVADSRDAMSLALNPAGLVDVGRQLQIGASLFMPYRSYDATAGDLGSSYSFIAPGSWDSSGNIFVVPNIAYNNPIDMDSSWGFSLYGNGGMNTNWPGMPNGTTGCTYGVPPIGDPGSGAFCAGTAGVDMMQAFIALGYARRVGAFSFGISPTLAIQRFKIEGIEPFMAVSSDPLNMTGRGYDYSYGGGVRAGVQWSVAPNLRLGLAGQTPMWMTKFSKYSGLFAKGGSFDIPASLTAGVAWDAMPNLTVMFDYRHIFYGSISSIANASWMPAGSSQSPPYCEPSICFGASNGAGFGWHDVDAFKVAIEWRASPAWTLRAGYAHNTSPIKSPDVALNVLAPGVVTDHITGGFAYKASANSTFEFAAAYVPSHSVSGPEILPQAFGGNTGDTIKLEMHQYQITLGYTYNFDTAPAVKTPLIHK